MNNDVSVILTTYYRNDALREAIETVLAQTYDPIEVVVVDDSGDRNAEPVVADYDVRYIAHEENRDQVAAWETGIAATDGTYVQFLDDDDLLGPGKIARQVAVFESDHDVGVVYCGVDSPDGECSPDPAVRGDVLAHALVFDMFPCYTTSMLIDRRCLEEVRPFTHTRNRTDIRLMIELARVTAFEYVDDILVEQRALDDRQRERDTDEHVRILAEYCHLASGRTKTRMLHLYHRGRCSRALSTNIWSMRAVYSGLAACYYMLRLGQLTPSTVGYAVVSLFGKPGYRFARALWPV
jgi:glycosyltransferase involved in cell wall biosynthesis